jgi:hypothetical protein
MFYNINKHVIQNIKKENVLDQLINNIIRLPTAIEIKKYLTKHTKKKHNADVIVNELRIGISKLDYKIPLYNPATNQIHLIYQRNVYPRVVFQHFRFPTMKLMKQIKDRLKPVEWKKYHVFLDQFDIDILFSSYTKAFYLSAQEQGQNLTNCIRLSYSKMTKHLTPFYRKQELINLGMNLGILGSDKDITPEKMEIVCKQVQLRDIPFDVLDSHRKYILAKDRLSLIRFFTLQGSFFMNQHLRSRGLPKNVRIENEISEMNKLILRSPGLDKQYVLYRFVKDDSMLSHLSKGDIFVDNGFLSTTRNPFYHPEDYEFGFVLIKIKLPKNKIGTCLAIETISLFPGEQEFMLPAGCMLRLDKKHDQCSYYHFDPNMQTMVNKRYEFSMVGSKLDLGIDRPIPQKLKILDPFKDVIENEDQLEGRIQKFLVEFANENYQVGMNVEGSKEPFIFTMEWYDGTSAYKQFYSNPSKNGFCMYVIKDHEIVLFIELSRISNNVPVLSVNYPFKFIPPKFRLAEKTLIDIVSGLAYYFHISTVVIFGSYDQSKNGVQQSVHVCLDFVDYLESGEKKFKQMSSFVMRSGFLYFKLDDLKEKSPDEILRTYDMDEIYQINQEKKQKNIKDLYLYLWKEYPYLVYELEKKMKRIYGKKSPFSFPYYVLNSGSYLYQQGLISSIPVWRSETTSIINENFDIDIPLPKNMYRLKTSF